MRKGDITIDGKIMGKMFGRYDYRKRGNLWAVVRCSYDYEGIQEWEKIDDYRTRDEAMTVAFNLNVERDKYYE